MTGALIPNYARYDVEFDRGEGCRLWDADGNEYLDLLAGIAVCNTGHCHPQVVAAVHEQAARLMHVSNLFYTAPMVRLAERLAARSLGGKVFFANSGAEANEAAIKLARKRRRGGRFVVLHGGFHGRTYGALSATPQETKQAPFAPLVPGFDAVLPEAAPAAVGPDTAGVVIELVQGETGVHPLPVELVREIRAACDEHGALLILDEVQTGMGRTGTLWAYERYGIRPRRDDAGQGPRRRAADRRAGHRAGVRRRVRARRPRLDLRRQPAGQRRRQRRARRHRRPRLPRGGARARRRCCARACASCRASATCAAPG